MIIGYSDTKLYFVYTECMTKGGKCRIQVRVYMKCTLTSYMGVESVSKHSNPIAWQILQEKYQS